MTAENREIRPDKVTHRTMGEYSIAKSFKGILRVAHIMELVDGESDDFLSSVYYGNPTGLMNISGGTYASNEFGYQTAIKGMQKGSGLQRYSSTNPRISNDPLKLHRVPLTDSMGNYLNWNVGTDGVTIGSNEDINGHIFQIDVFKQYQGEKDSIVYQEKFFPVLQTRDLTLGLENKIIASNKKSINDTTLSIERGKHDALMIVENMYDKSHKNNVPHELYRKSMTGEEIVPVNTTTYLNLISGKNQKYSKLRTIYKNTKPYSEDFDAFMYRQNDFDVTNYNYTDEDSEKDQKVTVNFRLNDYGSKYNDEVCDVIKTGKKIRDSIVDMVNLKDYVKKMILKYMKGNIVEVPTGAVIWQYCSLEKWRAHNESSASEVTELGEGGYPGHRPSLQIRETQARNVFGASTIQGVCRKINRLKRTSTNQIDKTTLTINEDQTIEDTSSMGIEESSDSLREIIPLYKRDYVLCDGSKYRIPYSAPLKKSAMRPFAEHQERFFELFFNIGYKYTERKFLLWRPKFKWNPDEKIYIPEDISSSYSRPVYINEKNITCSSLSDEWFNDFDKLPETPPYTQWYNIKNTENGEGYPKMIHPNDDYFDNCKELDVLFQEDLATMLACDAIYNEYHKENRLNGEEWNFKNVKAWLQNQKLPEEYIFNTFVGDSPEEVEQYLTNSKEVTNGDDVWFTAIVEDELQFGNAKPEIIEIDYKYCHDTGEGQNNENNFPVLRIGREVTYFGSPMKFYDSDSKKFSITSPSNLPMVNFFIYLMCSNHRFDGNLQMYFFSFYNYDFQVPNFMIENKTPVFIGSGAFGERDEIRQSIRKPQSWTSNFSEGDYPHRHGVFLWTGEGSEKQMPGKPNDGYDNNNFARLPELDGETGVALMSYTGGVVTNLRACSVHGGVLYNHDGNGNYIVKPVPMENETVYGTCYCPYNFMQVSLPTVGENDEVLAPTDTTGIGWVTGQGYKSGSSEMVDENPDKYVYFNENEGEKQLNFVENIPYSYSFSMKDDPRFVNAEPNRGLTGPPMYVDNEKLVKFKNSDAMEIWLTEDSNWFAPENIQMLPLIKL